MTAAAGWPAPCRCTANPDLQKQQLHVLFTQAPTPIAILKGSDHVIELANPLTCCVMGWSEPDVLGRPRFDVLPELADQPFKGDPA